MDFHRDRPTIDLNGQWEFAYTRNQLDPNKDTFEQLEAMKLEWRPATVPGNFDLDLQANGLLPEPFHGMNILECQKLEDAHVFYRRRFVVPKELREDPRLTPWLRFEGLDCFAETGLNGQRLCGESESMLVEQEVFLWESRLSEAGVWEDLLRESNELIIHIRPAVKGGVNDYDGCRRDYPPGIAAMGRHTESLYVRKAPHMYGWDIMPRALSAGMWRPVKLVFKPAERLEEVYLHTPKFFENGDAYQRLTFRAHFEPHPADAWELLIEGDWRGVGVSPASGAGILPAKTNDNSKNTGKMPVERAGETPTPRLAERRRIHFVAGQIWFRVSDPKLWWPRGYGDANLYDVKVSLIKNGQTIDTMSFTHGIRTVELIRTSTTDEEGHGDFHFRINGVKVFCKGSNHVPADAFHSRDKARLPKIIEMAAELECNILRCWGGNVYEDDLFFDLCDRAGIMVWQDFAMACAVYPQDKRFQLELEQEARAVIQRLRQHACIVLWAGDNECDLAYTWNHMGDPNRNVLTRQVLPEVVRMEDPFRPYLPSSPYIDSVAYAAGERFLPEAHLWGPRDYFKSEFYRTAICHFVSEIGYHGCPNVDSMRKFLSPEWVWPRRDRGEGILRGADILSASGAGVPPAEAKDNDKTTGKMPGERMGETPVPLPWQDNPEWILHSTNPTMGTDVIAAPDARVQLMVKQVRSLFGAVPTELEDFVFASQACQAEALKFFIERFRGGKWRRTGIIWWNLVDGWPQFSDAIVDYYFGRKLAYEFVRRSQQHVCLMLGEAEGGVHRLLAVNDTLVDVPVEFAVRDADSGAVLASGSDVAKANASTLLAKVEANQGPRFYVITWKTPSGEGVNHYLSAAPPVDLGQYRRWLRSQPLGFGV